MRITDMGENDLFVRMLGGFSMQYKGRLIAGGSKANDSQSVYLLQILIHAREKGVSRDQLEDLLFEDREISNVHHALQSVIYNTKKKLEKAGLTAVSPIEQRKGMFYWSEALPVVEDAAEFERLYRQSENAATPDEQLALIMDAVNWYAGEFLPMQTAAIWVAQEARRLKAMFCSCVERAAALLRMNGDYFQLEKLGLYAAKMDPLADWETLTMEALAGLRRYDEARRLYDDTVQFYFNEQGLRPSRRLMEQFERLGSGLKHEHAALDQIQSDLSGLTDKSSGGYLCTYPVFQGIYRMVERMMERGGQSVFLMLCTLVDSKGNPLREGPVLDELSVRMCDAVHNSIRRGDAMCLFGKGQVLALLVNTTRENCNIIQKRINYHFVVGRQRTGIEYYVNSLFWTPPGAVGNENGGGEQ